MNGDEFAGKWKQLRGKAREQWGKLTDSDMEQINGKRERLVGQLQERYGKTKEAAEEEVEAFAKKCGCNCD